MPFEPGQSGNPTGRIKGKPNKTTTQFKEALNFLLEGVSSEFPKWLNEVALEDPGRALDLVSKLAEYVHPKLARTEMTGKDGKDLIPTTINLNAK